MPVELGVQAVVGDIVAVAEAVAQLRTAVVHAGVVVRTFRHIDAPDAAGGLDIPRRKARRHAEQLRRLL